MTYFMTAGHLAALGATVLLALVFCAGPRTLPGRGWRVAAAVFGALLIGNELYYQVWQFQHHYWTWNNSLPLYLCDVAAYVAGLALITRRRSLAEVAYFWALAGSLQGLLTPDSDLTFGEYGYWQFYIDHVGVVVAGLALPIGLGLTPRRHAALRVFGLTALFTLFVGVTDALTGGNYMYLRNAPADGSLLNVMGPWPWYIVTGTVLAGIFLTILDVPFWRGRSRVRAARRASYALGEVSGAANS